VKSSSDLSLNFAHIYNIEHLSRRLVDKWKYCFITTPMVHRLIIDWQIVHVHLRLTTY